MEIKAYKLTFYGYGPGHERIVTASSKTRLNEYIESFKWSYGLTLDPSIENVSDADLRHKATKVHNIC